MYGNPGTRVPGYPCLSGPGYPLPVPPPPPPTKSGTRFQLLRPGCNSNVDGQSTCTLAAPSASTVVLPVEYYRQYLLDQGPALKNCIRALAPRRHLFASLMCVCVLRIKPFVMAQELWINVSHVDLNRADPKPPKLTLMRTTTRSYVPYAFPLLPLMEKPFYVQ